MVWKPLHHPMIQDGYLISDVGDIKCEISPEDEYRSELYHSTNGYDYAMFIVKEEYRINNSLFMLFPIDEMIAIAFIPIPEELTNKRITVKHIDGDTHNIELVNLEWIEDIEEWRDIDDPEVYSGMYEVSSWGRVRNKNTNTIINGSLTKKYMSVFLKTKSGNSCSRNINRLVAIAFIKGMSISRCIVNHINGNKLYNAMKNLEWVSYSENSRHAFLCGLNTPRCGEESISAKITCELAKHIWLLLIDDPDTLNGRPPTGGSPIKVKRYIDQEYNGDVTVAIISNIKHDKKWGNILFDKEFSFKPYAMSPELAKHIWLLLIDDPDTLNGRPPTGGNCKVVYEYLNNNDINLQNVYSIKFKHSWKSVTDKLPSGNLKDDRRKIDEKLAKHIWLLLIDDPDTLNGRPPTGGSALLVRNILNSEGYDVKLDMINSIKHKESWCNVTDNMKQVTFKPLHPKLTTPELAKHIWLLLIDDPDTLNGRPPTGGSPSRTLKYLENEGFIVSISTIKSIKYRTSWKNISHERAW